MTQSSKRIYFVSYKSVFIGFVFSFFFCYPGEAANKELHKIMVISSDSVYFLNHDDIKKGERLFYGLLPLGDDVESCVSCHNTIPSDTLNWNPSAYDISVVYSKKKLDELKNSLLNPSGKKLTEVHSGYRLDDDQLILLKGYLQHFYEKGGIEPKPIVDKLFIFLALLILFLIAIIDLLITKKIKFRAIHLAVMLITLFFITKTIVVNAIALGRQKDYMPLQPVKFSHKVHAGTNGTDCLYCHHTAEYSKTAGIPSLNVCWNCHAIVREGTNSGKFEINKIVEAHEVTKKPIKWIRIHNLPDHVFFSHAQHVGVGKLECKECHGPVDEMNVVRQYSDLSMGWCLDCHRTHKVQFIENDYYQVFKEYHDKIKTGELDSVLVEQIGGTNCQRCHY